MQKLLSIPLLLLAPSCAFLGFEETLPEGVECLSLDGRELQRLEFDEIERARLEQDLAVARARAEARPGVEEAAIWYGRRLGYLGRYNEAVQVYSDALGQHPTSYRLLRHRGHRYITLRRFEEAVFDLSEASRHSRHVPDRYEEDGAPNALGIPRSTTRSNIEYHLGLAHYLQREFDLALVAWDRCLYFSRVNDDMFVAATYWTVLTLWRLERHDEALVHLGEIRPQMDIIENHDYHELLLLFRGEREEAQLLERLRGASGVGRATLGFGLGAWHLANGREPEARALFAEVLRGTAWPAFGYIAAEVEVAEG
jgi:tetratricopeptide (TPR) repeat protein